MSPLTPFPIPVPLVCPHCGQRYSHGTVLSGNTGGATFYSDGAFDAPMLDQEVAIIRCIQCKYFVWVNDMTVPNTQRFIDRLCSWKIVPKTKPLTVPELAEALSEGFAKSKEEERFLRLSLWQRFNDRIRGFRLPTESKLLRSNGERNLWRENLVALYDLLDASIPSEQLMRAEIYRELGEFEKALECLDEITDTDILSNAQAVRRRCQERDPFVRVFTETNEENTPPSMLSHLKDFCEQYFLLIELAILFLLIGLCTAVTFLTNVYAISICHAVACATCGLYYGILAPVDKGWQTYRGLALFFGLNIWWIKWLGEESTYLTWSLAIIPFCGITCLFAMVLWGGFLEDLIERPAKKWEKTIFILLFAIGIGYCMMTFGTIMGLVVATFVVSLLPVALLILLGLVVWIVGSLLGWE